MTRNSCKFILVVLACSAPLTAAPTNAQQDSGASAGRHLSADNGAHSDALASPNALLSKREAANTSSQPAEASESSSAARQKIDALGAEDRPSSSSSASDNGERVWIMAVAALGLAASLTATGYLAWSRWQPSGAAVTVFMPRALPQSSRNPATTSMANKEVRPERRAA